MSAKEQVTSRAELTKGLTESFLKDHAREIATLQECVAKNEAATLSKQP